MLPTSSTIRILLLVAASGFIAEQAMAQTPPQPRTAGPAAPRAGQPTQPQKGGAQAPSATTKQPPARPSAAPKPGQADPGQLQPAQTQAGQAPAGVSRQVPAAGSPVRQVQHQQQAAPVLTKEEQAELDAALARWEKESDGVKILTASFTLFEYGVAFGAAPVAGQPAQPSRTYEGEIRFAAPDRGSYEITKGGDDRWMCDGKAIYEFNAKQKTLKEYRLPKELQGQAITNGPLPFVFGAKAEAMRKRYFMRVITPPDKDQQIWIEAWPRWQQDAANFHHVQVILDKKTMLPSAIRLYDPNPASNKVYLFKEGMKVNGTWDQIKDFFARPNTPLGWKHVVEDPPAEALPKDPPAAGATADARAKQAPVRTPAVKK